MLLELGKAVSFICCILSLYSVLMSSFFEIAATWQHRLALGLTRLALSACISFASGLLFRIPTRIDPASTGPDSTSPGRAISLWQTLPVRLFLCAAVVISVLFCLAWYVRCGGINSFEPKPDCY